MAAMARVSCLVVYPMCALKWKMSYRLSMPWGIECYVVGLRPRQYFYCGLCYGYTGNRVQKLAMTCKPVKVVPLPVGNLMNGIHPTDGTPLDTIPRRMSKRDPGFQTWCGTGNPNATFNAYVLEGDETVHPIGYTERSFAHNAPYSSDGDPFGHGVMLG